MSLLRPKRSHCPILINGVVRPGDYDVFQFTANAGQTITFDISAKRNESGVDSVLESAGRTRSRQSAYIDDFYWFKDPHIVHKFEKAGTYYLRVYGTGESGSENGDYRLTMGDMPQVDYAMPVGGQRGKTQEIRLVGVNLGTIGERGAGRWNRERGRSSRKPITARLLRMTFRRTRLWACSGFTWATRRCRFPS